MCTRGTPPGVCSAGRISPALIGGVWIDYIRQGLEDGQSIVAVPVTLFSCLVLLEIAECWTMDADGFSVVDNRAGVTFGVELYVPWDAPEAVVDVSQKLYVTAARSSATAYGSAYRGRVARHCLLASAMCGGPESTDGVCASPRPSRRAIGRRRPIRAMESPERIAPRLTVQDPLAAAGAVVLDCRPPLLPVSMNVSGVDLSAIQSSTMAAEADAVPPEREQSLGGGGGGDLLSLICPELGVAPLMDPETDLEDELSTPAVSPVAAVHRVTPLSAQADVDIELGWVYEDVVSLRRW